MKNINKKGSYLVESAISLPIFIIAVIVMYSIILMYSCIENSSFIIANELRRGSAESIYADTSMMIPYRITKEINNGNSVVSSVKTKNFFYRQSLLGNDELIGISVLINMETHNPIKIASKTVYENSCVTRAYVGKKRKLEPLSRSEFLNNDNEEVYLFPKFGKRYHKKGCNFIKTSLRTKRLDENLRKKLNPCPVCKSKNAKNGTLITFFPRYGDDFHLNNCPVLKRKFIPAEKSVAIKRGYTACKKCGGR